ncbi:MAG TPA: hypothetical protein VFA54_06505 [Bryobacterales bacterium]|jgi:hypothetical protein|nr:hypothetical protein [Bryobacterales bacterium]
MASPSSLLAENSGDSQQRPLKLWRRIQTIVFILFCLEMGVVLVLFPWSSMWDRNYFFALAPQFGRWFASSYLRGAISGVGLVNVWIAVSEAWRLRSA